MGYDMDEDGKNLTGYRKIEDLQTYVRKMIRAGAQMVLAKKTARIAARPGVPGEQIVSWSVDMAGAPVMEKTAVVSVDAETGIPGWVVTKVDENNSEITDRNGHNNQWIIDNAAFQKKYREDPEHPGIYKSVSGPQRFVRLDEAIHISQYGQEWNVDAGGYINVTASDDLYVISGREFTDTYRIIC